MLAADPTGMSDALHGMSASDCNASAGTAARELYGLLDALTQKRRPKAAHRRALGLGERVLATPIGFEPTISTVTGWRAGPLHHGAA